MRDPLAEERARAVEIVQIAVPVLVEAVVAIFAIGVACMWVIILATEVPA
jgi:hypothetical protein